MLPQRVGPTLPQPGWPVWLALVVIVAAGASLRAWGAGAGAPYRMGVDEPVIVSNALRMIRTGDFNPHFFDYGGLTLYLHAAVAALAFMFGAMDGRWSHLDAIWEGDLLVAGRLATALLSTLTIVVVFRAGLRWGTGVALIAAAVMAMLPAHVREAHFILTDTPLTFFIAVALLLSIRASEDRRLSSLALAAVAVGLATAIKYNGVVSLLMPALVAAGRPRGQRLAGLAVVAAVSAATFLAAAPYTVLALPAFLNGMAFLMQSYNRHRPLPEAMSNYVAYLRNWFTWPGVLPAAVGYGSLLVIALGFVRMVVQPPAHARRSAALLVIGFAVIYFWFVSAQALQYGRYLMPIGPMLALGLAVGVTTLGSLVVREPARTITTALVALVLLAPPAASAISWNRAHSLTTTADQAAAWLTTHGQPRDRVVVEAVLFHLPPHLHATRVPDLTARTLAQYQQDGVQYLVASSLVSDRYHRDPAAHADAMSAYRTLLALTVPVATFVPDARHPGSTLTILRVPAPVP